MRKTPMCSTLFWRLRPGLCKDDLSAMAMIDFDPDGAAVHDGVFGLPHDSESARVVLLPVPFDATASYRLGARDGPAAMRAASMQVDLHDVETAEPWQAGIFMLPESGEIRALNDEARRLAAPIKRAGGAAAGREELRRVNEIGARVTDWLRAESSRWLDRGKLVGVVGGDHASPLGAIRALAERHPGMGILHIDAHADLRVSYEGFEYSHASIMHNVLERVPDLGKVVQVGVRDLCAAEVERIASSRGKVQTWFDADMHRAVFEGETYANLVRRLLDPLPSHVHVSLDIDALDPSLCPHTGTPVPGGLSFRQLLFLLGALARSGRRIVGFDLCEVAPGREGDAIDAIVGVRALYALIGWMVVSNSP